MTNSPCNVLKKRLLLYAIAFLLPYIGIAQKNTIKGVIEDSAAKKKLQYAIVALIDTKDSLLYRSIRSTEDGSFLLTSIPSGKYKLMISFPGMADYLDEFLITDTTKKDLGKIPMLLEAALLKEVVVKYVPPIRMKGDTLEYTADSFQVKPGANVEELLKRLPGIQVDRNGKITAQGKEVRKVLVDGDEFFSDDPGLATKYLNADAVDKVQVFDKKSDVAEFTGIDDGKRTKTINLKLKENKKRGYFGKLSAASDKKDYYNYDAMSALFRGSEKMSVFGMGSRTGRNALSYNEITKYVGQDYERIDDGTGQMMFTSNTSDYEPESYYGNGIPSIISGGAHYSNKWKKDRQKLVANYRVKNVDVSGWNNSKNTSVLPDGTMFVNNSESKNKSSGLSQKGSGSFVLPIDSLTSLKISLNGNWYSNNSIDSTYSASKNEKGYFVNNSRQSVSRINDGKNFSSDISFNKQFKKKGRTLSANLQQEDGRSNNHTFNYAANNYFEPSNGNFKNADTLNQLQKQVTSWKTIAIQARFADKLSEHLYAAIEYGYKHANAGNLFATFNKINEKYDGKVDTLSNDYSFISNTHITGASLSWSQQKLKISIGSKFFFTGFNQQNNDVQSVVKRSFVNFAPNASVALTFKDNKQFNITYNGHTDQPGVEQLQPLRQSGNPLYVLLGNPLLVPSFTHDFSLNYSSFNWVKGKNFYVYAFGSYTQNSIADKSFTDSNNRTVNQYINMDGIPNFNGGANYGWEYKPINLRPSVDVSVGRYGNYAVLNNVKNKSETVYINTSIRVDYRIKELATMNYSGVLSYSVGKSTLLADANKTWSHTHTIGSTFYLPLKFELASDCIFSLRPKNSSFNTSLNNTQWNASVAKKVFKNDRGIIKLSVNDILNSNTGYNRGVNGSNTYEINRLVIKRYWLLGFTWNFSKN